MPFTTGKEFLGYLFVMTLGFLDAFLLAHPSLILLTDNTFPELNFLTRLSTTTFLVLALLSVFYVATGMTLHGAAVQKRLLPRSEARRGGKGGVRSFRCVGLAYHEKQNKNI